jgi:hypothetical protein
MREETYAITPKDLANLNKGEKILLLNDGETKVFIEVEDFLDINPTDDLEPIGEPATEVPEVLVDRDGRFPDM